jgi:hypothetical protein
LGSQGEGIAVTPGTAAYRAVMARLDAESMSLRPSTRQLLRRLISDYRHESRRVPWGEVEWRAYKAATRLDIAAEIRAAIAISNARPPLDDSDEWSHGRTTDLAQRAIARSIWAGGEA